MSLKGMVAPKLYDPAMVSPKQLVGDYYRFFCIEGIPRGSVGCVIEYQNFTFSL